MFLLLVNIVKIINYNLQSHYKKANNCKFSYKNFHYSIFIGFNPIHIIFN